MVFVEIPKQHSEEEKILLQKYQKLKRKKKALIALKAPPKAEAAPAAPLKRVAETGPKQDAKEIAKKLIRTGAISAIKAPEKRDCFKRSKAGERKRAGDHKPGGYQPFSSVAHSSDSMESSSDNVTPEPASPLRAPYQSGVKYSLYDNFVSPKDAEHIAREETHRERRRDGKANYVNRDVPHQGNTVYVRGVGVSENLLRTTFSPFGTVIDITLEIEKNCGFITFETIDEANEAISQMNQKTVDGINLQVTLARRQPHLATQAANEQSSSAAINSWTAIASSFTVKGKESIKTNHQDKRDKVVYDTNLFD